MRIKKLPIALANQIAAGEVIEKPASVVKELLENALDAKATMITIEISHGGLNQIKVSDNGNGIIAEDLPLAIAPHATSKISKLNDLYAINSMGFRGEALASIASISRFSMMSKPKEQENGMQLVFQNNELTIVPCARSDGTTIDVKDIFFNAPVRKKFLKPKQFELQAIEMTVKRFALSAAHITIILIHDEKCLLNLPATSKENFYLLRVSKLLGKQFIDHSIAIGANQSGLELEGWISGVAYQRSQNDKIWVYINGRMVKDKLINHAIKQAYEDFLHPGRHPVCLLYLSLDSQEVDVNVHPTKHEVRFHQPRLVHDFIYTHLRKALKQSEDVAIDYNASMTPSEHYEVKEPCLTQLYTPTLNKAPKILDSSWIQLNKKYSIFILNGLTCLLDFQRFKQHWLSNALSKSSFPLESRPILVPIHFLLPDKINFLTTTQALLIKLGIQHEIKMDKMFVRSLPLIAPNLPIKSFLSAFFSLSIDSFDRAKSLLIQYEAEENEELTKEQKEIYLDYLCSMEQELSHQPFIKLLSTEVCRDFFNA